MFNKIVVLVLVSLFLTVSFGPEMALAAEMPKPGDVVKTKNSPTVFYVDDGLANIPLDASAFAVRYKNNFGLIKTVSEDQIKPFASHHILNRVLSVAEGSIVMYYPNPTVYLIENGKKRGFTSWSAYVNRGYSNKDIQVVGTYHIYATGEAIK